MVVRSIAEFVIQAPFMIEAFYFIISMFPAASATECAVCDAFMSAVHYRLGNSAVAESIEKAVLKACNYVPGRYQSKVS